MKNFTALPVFLAISLGWLMQSCSSAPTDPPVDLTTYPMTAEFYTQGRITSRHLFQPQSPEAKVIRTIIKSKRGKWEQSTISYASQIDISCGPAFIVFIENALIIQYKNTKGQPIQLITPITSNELQSVRKFQ
jgi:hypothetical protein